VASSPSPKKKGEGEREREREGNLDYESTPAFCWLRASFCLAPCRNNTLLK